ncbi:hypothetical protein F9817_17270 [Vibrio sp. CAIM 722]|uniref:6-carboxy-5,6,7,8-tetrahydropterin synthase n=1 Tax=Vibrio eleionomae TaxID=2653505 RepID=A0A7X4RW27_9VIBR|nr:6-carboxytetrahydropterin synthase [Vibrio eleionomae]MZI94930.1 hypothetical protein [Vibrio eleionomae]
MKTAMYVDDLTAIDFSVYNGLEICGDSVSLSVMVTGKLNESGMISDFGKIKPRLKAICDNEVDHRLVCDPKFLTNLESQWQGEFPVSSGVITVKGPRCMFCEIKSGPENYVEDIKQYLHDKFNEVMPEFEFELTLSHNRKASFQYNHGLKLHDGNCQRIIHGHSAELEILIDGKLCAESQAMMIQRLNGKHLFNESDVVHGEERSTVSYSASQGQFEVQLPNELLEIVAGEPSIENISKHIAQIVLSNQSKASSVRVRVSEGLSKGAVTLI